MRNALLITGSGTATWGGLRFALELVIRTRTWWDSTTEAREQLVSYELLTDEPSIGGRAFGSAAERDTFIALSLRDVKVVAVQPPASRQVPHALDALRGTALDSAILIRDHLQLRYDDHSTLTCNVWPVMVHEDQRLTQGQSGYLEALVSLIGVPMLSVDELLDQGLVLVFASGTVFQLPMRTTDASGVELVALQRESELFLWMAGDGPPAWS